MEILFHDREIAVCIKPVGLDSEAEVPAQLKQALGGEIFPLHRLDKNVGGDGLCTYQSRRSKALKSHSGRADGERICGHSPRLPARRRGLAGPFI